MPPSHFGIGYAPIGDLLDIVDPFGIHKLPSNLAKLPGAAAKKADQVITRAENVVSGAGARVEHSIDHAVGEAKEVAIVFAACGVLATAILGGVYLHSRKAKHAEARRR